jgi:hypothetical protein
MNGSGAKRDRRDDFMTKRTRIALIMLLALVVLNALTACGGGFTGNPAIFH